MWRSWDKRMGNLPSCPAAADMHVDEVAFVAFPILHDSGLGRGFCRTESLLRLGWRLYLR